MKEPLQKRNGYIEWLKEKGQSHMSLRKWMQPNLFSILH